MNSSNGTHYFSYGSDISEAGVYLSGNHFCITMNGWFKLNRSATSTYDVFHIFTMKFEHCGRVYSTCIKAAATDTYVLDYDWDEGGKRINMWVNGNAITSVKDQDYSTFFITFTPRGWTFQ